MGDKISQLPAATSVDGTEIVPIVQAGTTKKVTGLILRNPAGPASGDLTGSFPNPSLAAITTAQTAGSATQVPVVTIDAKGRVTSLSTAANPQGTVTSVVAGTGLTGGTITSTGTLAVSYGTTAGTAAQGNDSRFAAIPAASTTLPSPDGAAAIGTSTAFARADHVHERQSVALTGDVAGSGVGSISTSLASITTAQTNIGSGTQVPVISVDAKGRVTSLSSVPVSASVDAITALTGDVTAAGPGSANAALATITTAQTNIGSSTTVPIISVDAKGRVTALGSTPISGSAGGTVTSITAGAGLSGGTITDSGTIALADVTTAQTAVGDSTTIPVITVNAKGQITALTTAAAAGGVALATTAPANLASTAAVGTGTTAARADHQHAFPTAAQVGALEATAVAGGDLTGNYPNPELNTVAVTKGGTGQTSFTNGQLLIGNSTGNTLSKATLTAGENVTITNGPGSITVSAVGLNVSASILCVAGGGGATGAGGGAGGLVQGNFTLSRGTTYTITVGAGGAGANPTTTGAAVSGSNSSISSLSISSIGGGRAGTGGVPNGGIGGNGGSGGGAGPNGSISNTTIAGGSGTVGQGNNGGSTPGLAGSPSGGGGGAGAVGANGVAGAGGNGGIGLQSSITGTAVYYAGGGGGSIGSGTQGIGGLGGGGNAIASGTGANGAINTGGGAGAASNAGIGGNGGSGVVIISLPTASYTGTVTGSPTVTTSGSNTIITFTSSGTYTA